MHSDHTHPLYTDDRIKQISVRSRGGTGNPWPEETPFDALGFLPILAYFQHADAALHEWRPGLSARPIALGDMAFLRSLYASTRADELAASDWSDQAQQAFLAQQFALQHRYYQEHHEGAIFLLLASTEGERLGRLYWRGSDRDEATLIDICLVPEARGHGLGTALMSMLLSQADCLRQSIGLHVEPDNPARRLYERCGFELQADNGVYARMRRTVYADPQMESAKP